MHKNIELCLATAALAAMSLGAPAARAAGDAAGEQSSVMIRCEQCGKVYSIRRIEKAVAPERELMPNTGPSAAGGTGHQTQAVPLISFGSGSGGAQRVQREPATRSVWEMTVRYDNGEFGVATLDSQPVFAVGDRVRRVDNAFVPHPPAGR
ncbi:MAG: hypothetical protein MUP61_06295 [Burkholderiales bacterium]|nr:hypothetical protein [Burkholderiales bacterium]